MTSNIISSLMRTCEGFNFATDKIGFFISLEPTDTNKILFQYRYKRDLRLHNKMLDLTSYKYWFNNKIDKNRRQTSHTYASEKIQQHVFAVKCCIVCQSSDKVSATGKIKALYNNFLIFQKFPYNKRSLQMDTTTSLATLKK